MSGSGKVERGNYVSEWFGHRMYPSVVSDAGAIADQQRERCPFLSAATDEDRKCIKADASKGVCTINCASNGVRQDWLVCPYRALSQELIGAAVRRLFELEPPTEPRILPAINLEKTSVREDVSARLARGELVFIYFDAKLGGELSIPPTDSSPEFSFDVTIIELVQRDGQPHVGGIGILEIQTMDFHGSYRAAVRNLREGLRMHGERFAETVGQYQHWLGEGVEGPNIANVFKRTFYQMMFKFQLGQHEKCAGCVLAIPEAVWGSWQRHLGQPTLTHHGENRYSLDVPNRPVADVSPAWIFVFDTKAGAATSPSPIFISKEITTSAQAVGYWALEEAPKAALERFDATPGLMANMARRLKALWPELARTIHL